MTHARAAAALAAAALAAAGAPKTAPAVEIIADLSAHRIEITTGFTGAEVLLFGVRDGGGDVVAVLRGPPESVVVRRKRRSFGMWLNRRQIEFPDAPGYYAVAASRPPAEIAPARLFAQYGVGVSNAVRPPGAGPEAEAFRDALVRLKVGSGHYRESPNGVSFVEDKLFRAVFALPADAPTGLYRAEVLSIVDGDVAARRVAGLTIGKTGFGAAMYEFAHSRPLAYGVFAALAALAAGWTAGMVFRRR